MIKSLKLLLLLKFLLFLASLLLLTEVGLGYFFYKNEYNISQSNPQRFIRLRENLPNSEIQMTLTEELKEKLNLVNFDRTEIRLTADDDGFVEPSKIYANADLNIFFVGGSTIECKGLAPEKRYPYLVGRMLEKRMGSTINSFNAGVSGNHSLHSINILLNKILPYKPEVVVFKQNSTDLLLIAYESYWNNAPGKSLIVTSNSNDNHGTEESDYIFPILVRLASLAFGEDSPPHSKDINNDIGPDNVTKYSRKTGETFTVNKADIINQYKSALRTFIHICKDWNIKPVLMTQAAMNPGNIELMQEIPDEFEITLPEDPFTDPEMLKVIFTFHGVFNDIIREIASEENIGLIDLNYLVPAKSHKYIYDIFHYNTAGSHLVADIITDHLFTMLNASDSDTTEVITEPN